MAPLPFRQSYAALPERFYASAPLSPAPAPKLIRLNHALAEQLGLDAEWLASPEGVAMLSGSAMPEGVEPLSMAYAGHQFGSFNPHLGDGRALLLGDVQDAQGHVWEVQLKGSGPTPFSRRGDGRAVLGPVLREYVVSEVMHALGIPTTRALAAVKTGMTVLRETMLPGAVLARVASSHIRVGTFQYFASRQDMAGLRLLADFAIARHYPQVALAPAPYLAFLQQVIEAQAKLIAQWMLVGFIHGVMNTDNMAVSGETIDYGPCAFMDQYDPNTVFSFIDERGRYAFTNQPTIALWNLTRLAEALLPLLSEDEEESVALAGQALEQFGGLFHGAYFAGLRAKLGLKTQQAGDETFFHALFAQMQEHQADFTNTFRSLSDERVITGEHVPDILEGMQPWLTQWRQRLMQEVEEAPAIRAENMRRVNPCYIPRNHLIEAMISAAVNNDDYTLFEEMLQLTASPYTEQADMARYAQPPQPEERVRYTFCGT
ncbi:protein adenylyltransferase SelO [Acetobacter pasteurianus]|uniref:protein adenylyltransferase SelO n=1 Tax=Acetobacter pasteurianus TaxID=438 RepID=UPI000F57D215|nr:YdiU family protein [Acetobacter pasteurianus]GCD56656.1 hypothetical protein NBRC3222_1993 [Acetobacter pasteurianus NBRC 3222]